MKHKGVILYFLFVAYALATAIINAVNSPPGLDIPLAFILGVVALLLVPSFLAINKKVFSIALFFFLVGSSFYFEFQPFATTSFSFRFNSIVLFNGKLIPFLFLLVFLFLYRKEIVHFSRTTKLWN